LGNDLYTNLDDTSQKPIRSRSNLVASVEARDLMNVVASKRTLAMTLNGTMTWTAADSPVSVSDDLIVSGTLVIDAGTTVLFETPTSGITVKSGGKILIRGHLNNRVILKAQQESWSGIRFEAGSAPSIYDDNQNYVDGSTIQYTDIIRAGYSPYTRSQSSHGLSFPEGVCPYLVGVDMTDCGGHYSGSSIHIQKLKRVFVARNLRVLKSTESGMYQPGYAIFIQGIDKNSGMIVIENTDIVANSRVNSLHVNVLFGVSINHSSFANELQLFNIFEVSINHSSFANELQLSNIFEVSTTKSTFSSKVSMSGISQTFISENSFDEFLYLTSMGGTGGTLVVTQNSILNSKSNENALYVGHYNLPSPSAISNNIMTNGRLFVRSHYYGYRLNITIEQNIVSDSSHGGMYLDILGWASLTNNTIEDCSASSALFLSGSGINAAYNSIKNCKSTSSPVISLNAESGGQFHFTDNEVINNMGHHIFYLKGSSNYATDSLIFSRITAMDNNAMASFVRFDEYPWTFTENIFESNSAPLSVDADLSSEIVGNFLALPLNHWGPFQHDIMDLRTSVCDGFAQSYRPMVDFDPVLSESSVNR
jgi:parallel beta-helix repeat protein